MKKLSKTQWIGRAESIRAVWQGYEILLDVLLEIQNCEGSDCDSQKTASNLLEKIQLFDFYLSILFKKSIMCKMNIVILEVQEIDYDILAGLDAMRLTRNEMLRIRDDEVGLNRIITAALEKSNPSGIDAHYEFSKKHRPRRNNFQDESTKMMIMASFPI